MASPGLTSESGTQSLGWISATAVFAHRGQIRVEGLPVAHWSRNCASSGARMAARACATEIRAGGGLALANGRSRAAARGASFRTSRAPAVRACISAGSERY